MGSYETSGSIYQTFAWHSPSSHLPREALNYFGLGLCAYTRTFTRTHAQSATDTVFQKPLNTSQNRLFIWGPIKQKQVQLENKGGKLEVVGRYFLHNEVLFLVRLVARSAKGTP